VTKQIDTYSEKQIVFKVEPGMDRDDILCTTYQMRNFYRQLGDGFFSNLDTMNYIQHHQIAKWCKKGYQVLDVCCGRGLLLPLLRYLSADIAGYTGVDIRPENAVWQKQRVTDNKPVEKGYYPFKTRFVESNVADMATKLAPIKFDVIVYTSALEHMHKDMGQASLVECRKVAKPGTMLVLTCPNTPETQDGYDTQYAAHVYEWKRSELLEGLTAAGWKIITEYGLLVDRDTLHAEGQRLGLLPLIERVEKMECVMATQILTVPNPTRVTQITLESPWSSRDCTLGARPFLATAKVEYQPRTVLLEFCSFEKWLLRFIDMSVTLESSCQEIFDALDAVLSTDHLRVTITGQTTSHGPASAVIEKGDW